MEEGANEDGTEKEGGFLQANKRAHFRGQWVQWISYPCTSLWRFIIFVFARMWGNFHVWVTWLAKIVDLPCFRIIRSRVIHAWNVLNIMNSHPMESSFGSQHRLQNSPIESTMTWWCRLARHGLWRPWLRWMLSFPMSHCSDKRLRLSSKITGDIFFDS